MFRRMLSVLSPAGERARLSVLVFHRVHAAADALFPQEPDAVQFDAVCGWLKAWFEVMPLDEAARRLRDGSLPARALSITFDDGYADNHAVALPILRRHGLTATFFIATGFLDGGCMFNDRVVEAVRATRQVSIDPRPAGIEVEPLLLRTLAERRAAIPRLLQALKYLPHGQRPEAVERLARMLQAQRPGRLMMSSQQVRSLHDAGMQIGAHTVTHPILSGLDPGSAAQEIDDSRRALQALTGSPVTTFAYPNGQPGIDYSPESVDLVRRLGFTAAVSTVWGAARRHTDLFQLPRFTPWDRGRVRFGARMLANLRR
jgi:peptidoglycan/xylan/chitin deacetylase (PgdA/CDA1 family)